MLPCTCVTLRTQHKLSLFSVGCTSNKFVLLRVASWSKGPSLANSKLRTTQKSRTGVAISAANKGKPIACGMQELVRKLRVALLRSLAACESLCKLLAYGTGCVAWHAISRAILPPLTISRASAWQHNL